MKAKLYGLVALSLSLSCSHSFFIMTGATASADFGAGANVNRVGARTLDSFLKYYCPDSLAELKTRNLQSLLEIDSSLQKFIPQGGVLVLSYRDSNLIRPRHGVEQILAFYADDTLKTIGDITWERRQTNATNWMDRDRSNEIVTYSRWTELFVGKVNEKIAKNFYFEYFFRSKNEISEDTTIQKWHIEIPSNTGLRSR